MNSAIFEVEESLQSRKAGTLDVGLDVVGHTEPIKDA